MAQARAEASPLARLERAAPCSHPTGAAESLALKEYLPGQLRDHAHGAADPERSIADPPGGLELKALKL